MKATSTITTKVVPTGLSIGPTKSRTVSNAVAGVSTTWTRATPGVLGSGGDTFSSSRVISSTALVVSETPPRSSPRSSVTLWRSWR